MSLASTITDIEKIKKMWTGLKGTTRVPYISSRMHDDLIQEQDDDDIYRTTALFPDHEWILFDFDMSKLKNVWDFLGAADMISGMLLYNTKPAQAIAFVKKGSRMSEEDKAVQNGAESTSRARNEKILDDCA